MPVRRDFDTDEGFLTALCDYFAGQAIAGMLADPEVKCDLGELDDFVAKLSQEAYMVGRAMIRERESR